MRLSLPATSSSASIICQGRRLKVCRAAWRTRHRSVTRAHAASAHASTAAWGTGRSAARAAICARSMQHACNDGSTRKALVIACLEGGADPERVAGIRVLAEPPLEAGHLRTTATEPNDHGGRRVRRSARAVIEWDTMPNGYHAVWDTMPCGIDTMRFALSVRAGLGRRRLRSLIARIHTARRRTEGVNWFRSKARSNWRQWAMGKQARAVHHGCGKGGGNGDGAGDRRSFGACRSMKHNMQHTTCNTLNTTCNTRHATH